MDAGQHVHPDTVVVTYGTPTIGLWCPTCLLPTAYEADALFITIQGVSPVGKIRGCTESDDPSHYRPSPGA